MFGSLMSPRPDPLLTGDPGDDESVGANRNTPTPQPTSSACNIVKPIMGGVFQLNSPTGEWIAWTGGKPKVDWTGLENAAGVPTPLMYRLVGGKDAKQYEYRLKGLSEKFETKNCLRAFARNVMKHLRQCGMDAITYLPDPANPTVMESIVEKPDKFTKEYVMTKISEYESKYDSYDKLNAQTATYFVLSSLSPKLEGRVSEALISSPDASLLLTWMTFIEKIRILSVGRFQLLSKQIEARVPTNYPGENLTTMAEENIIDYFNLIQSGWFNFSTGVIAVDNFALANPDCRKFSYFASKMATEYTAAVYECSYMEPKDRNEYMDQKGFNFEKVCLAFSAYYTKAKGDGNWKPSTNTTPTATPPRNFGNLASTNGNSALNLVQTGTSNRSSGSNRSSDTCNNCGKQGHWARDCPSRNNRKGGGRGFGNGGRSGGRGFGGRGGSKGKANSSWTRVPPEPNQPKTKVEHGKTFHWCATCKRWSTSHGTDQHRGKPDQGNDVPTKVNFSLVENYAAWNCKFLPPKSNMVAPNETKNFVTSMLTSIFITLGLMDIVLCYTQVLVALHTVGFGILAPLVWIASLALFFHYQPILAVPPPAPDPPAFNRKTKRRFGQLLRNSFPANRKKKGPSILDHGFHRSYPMRLRCAGTFNRRSELQRAVSQRTHGIPRTTRREGAPSPAQRAAAKAAQPFNNVPFERMSFSQKRAVANIENYVCMYRPAQRQYTHRKCPSRHDVAETYTNDFKKIDISKAYRKANAKDMLTLDRKNYASIAQVTEEKVNSSSLIQHLGKYAQSWFRSHLSKVDVNATIIWDSGASISISPNRGDFVGEIIVSGKKSWLQGITNQEVEVEGHGYVVWTMEDVHGMLRSLKVPCLLVPNVPQRLLSTTSLLQSYPDETISLSGTKMVLSGSKKGNKGTIEAFVDPKNNLPTTILYDHERTNEAAKNLAQLVTTVSEENRNLGPAEKELLKWHQRLAHIDFRKVLFLFRSGVLSHGETTRRLHSTASKITTPPKCAACQFGKQCQRSVPTTTQAKVSDKVGAISRKCTLPGEQISVDHFVCKVKGRLFTSKGKTDESLMYSGGCVFVDHYSGMIHVELQQNLNTHETLKAKEKFESMARDSGVIPQTYLSDNGPAFASHEFAKHLSKFEQVSKFAGAGAHHQNGIAERSIRTVISIARTIMIHAAIHWPEVSDPCLWPMAVQHASYVFNRMPHLDTGLCPLDLFNRQRWKQSQLHDLHVWGCPVYVLDKRTADGVKIPKWKPRSNRFIYMGISNKHASSVPLLFNPESGVISPQYHVVFDDWFATISTTSDDLPDFNSESWQKLFGESSYQYVREDDSDNEDTVENVPAEVMDDAISRQNRVERALDRQAPPTPLSVPPHPMTELPEYDIPALDSPLVKSSNQSDLGANGFVPQEVPNRSTPASSPTVSRNEPEPRSFSPSPPSLVTQPEQREIDQLAAPVGSPMSVSTPSSERPINQTPVSVVQRTDTPDENSRRVTRSMSRPNQYTPERRSTRARRPPEKLNLLAKSQIPFIPLFEIEVPHCYNLEHPSSEFSASDMDSHYSYLVDALTSTTPTIVSASSLVSVDAFKASVGDPDTLSYDEAMSDKEFVDEWRAAAQKEIKSLEDHGTWEVVDISQATSKVLPGTWVFRVKRSPDGTITKRKARYCVRGDLQEGQRETFAPVVAWSTVRLFLILAILLNWDTSAIDFSSAFVQALLTEPTWIHLPRGFLSGNGNRKCLRLKKSLYGLSAAPRLWYLHLFDALVNKLGFIQSKLDRCLLMKKDMMIVVFVDDCGIAYRRKCDFDKLVSDLRKLDFELTEEGSFTSFLGIKFNRTQSQITMTQSGLINRIADATGLTDCNPNHTPTIQESLGSDPDGVAMKEKWNYRSVIGMMLYLATNTRPDIAFAVSQAARYSNNPKQSHAIAVKTIVRYLVGTKDKGTIVTPTGKLDIKLYVDADFAGLFKKTPDSDRNSARSRTGYILILGGFPLIWKSHLQTEISLSTLEAEYSALSSATRALIPIRELLFEVAATIELPQTLVTSIYCSVFEDNQGAYLLATTHRITARTKYFLVKFHHFWYYVAMEDGNDRKINIFKCSTTEQAADMLTKGQPRIIFQSNRLIVIGW
jgi:Reverse transcriptase (RNA-dependent DNA polymerase)/Zinc knuckle